MHAKSDAIAKWRHDHSFGQQHKRTGEGRTLVVIALTAAFMAIEVAAGVLFGSMALLADGLHMASHAAALTVNVVAYVYARRQAHNSAFSFGTGKVNALGGYTGAVLLAIFALMMAVESVSRLLAPVTIAFDQAIVVAVLGLIVNGACVFILDHESDHDHEHHHAHEEGGHHHDHNLRSAYLHVLADALTSLLAIVALLFGKYMGLVWMDPLMGIVGAILVARWSIGLVRSTSSILLDRQGPGAIEREIRAAVEDGDSRIADLHLWSIGPGIYSVVMSVVAHEPVTPEEYKRRIPGNLGLEHVTVEVHECVDEQVEPALSGSG